jgi:hypothetical protein
MCTDFQQCIDLINIEVIYMCEKCKDGYCRRCHGMFMGLIGVLILINICVWPQWTGIDGWIGFFAVLMIIFGICKSVMPACNCCKKECSTGAVAEEAKTEPAAEVPDISIPEIAKHEHKASKKKK